MPRMDEEFSTHRLRQSIGDPSRYVPDTLADQLRNKGNTKLEIPTDAAGNPSPVPASYPVPGNAGFDNDNDADDYNWAAYQQGSTTSSSGPP